MASQEPVLSRSVQVIKQEANDLGLKGQDIVQYVKQQALEMKELPGEMFSQLVCLFIYLFIWVTRSNNIV